MVNVRAIKEGSDYGAMFEGICLHFFFLGLGNAGDEMLSAASEIIKDRNDLTEKLEQELSGGGVWGG